MQSGLPVITPNGRFLICFGVSVTALRGDDPNRRLIMHGLREDLDQTIYKGNQEVAEKFCEQISDLMVRSTNLNPELVVDLRDLRNYDTSSRAAFIARSEG
jgi:hypothetical protein